MYINYIFVLFVFSLTFLNGLTDAVNSVSSLYILNKKAFRFITFLNGFFNFLGCLIFCVFFSNVVNSISNLINLNTDSNQNLVLINISIISVLIFTSVCWYFGLATSESHSLLGSICGVGLVINSNKSEFLLNIINVLKEQCLSLIFGFVIGYTTFFVIKNLNFTISKKHFFINSFIISFFHGAQDGQKFFSLIILAFPTLDIKNKIIFIVLISFFIGLGTFFCSEKIVKKVNSVTNINHKPKLFAVDFSNILCIFLVTLRGLPISTTYVKLFSMLGVSRCNKDDVIKKTLIEILMSFILTFPISMFFSYFLCKIILKI